VAPHRSQRGLNPLKSGPSICCETSPQERHVTSIPKATVTSYPAQWVESVGVPVWQSALGYEDNAISIPAGRPVTRPERPGPGLSGQPAYAGSNGRLQVVGSKSRCRMAMSSPVSAGRRHSGGLRRHDPERAIRITAGPKSQPRQIGTTVRSRDSSATWKSASCLISQTGGPDGEPPRRGVSVRRLRPRRDRAGLTIWRSRTEDTTPRCSPLGTERGPVSPRACRGSWRHTDSATERLPAAEPLKR
jgi:hypothetical protein